MGQGFLRPAGSGLLLSWALCGSATWVRWPAVRKGAVQQTVAAAPPLSRPAARRRSTCTLALPVRESNVVDKLLNKRYAALYPTAFATYRRDTGESADTDWVEGWCACDVVGGLIAHVCRQQVEAAEVISLMPPSLPYLLASKPCPQTTAPARCGRCQRTRR